MKLSWRIYAKEPYELTHTDLSCAKAFPKIKIKIECECARISRQLSAWCSSQSSTSMLSVRWFITAIARRARRTHSARQMHTFIESICPQGHNLLFFIFISLMALVERSLSVYLYISKSEFHICRILFYGSEKQCRKSSPVCSHTGRTVVRILDCYTSIS